MPEVPTLKATDIADCTEAAITELCAIAVALGVPYNDVTPFECLTAILAAVKKLAAVKQLIDTPWAQTASKTLQGTPATPQTVPDQQYFDVLRQMQQQSPNQQQYDLLRQMQQQYQQQQYQQQQNQQMYRHDPQALKDW